MSLSDVFRDRYYEPGYVYIAGSLSERVIKVGTTKRRPQQRNLGNPKYGEIGDWVLLYYVWVDQGGKVEHKVLRRLRCYQTLRMYTKDGKRQKGREIVQCPFNTALDALFDCVGEEQRSDAWQSDCCGDFDFDRYTADSNDFPPATETLPLEKGRVNFLKKVVELDLSVRTATCLKNENIIYIGDLAQKTEAAMLCVPNFGRRSLNESRTC